MCNACVAICGSNTPSHFDSSSVLRLYTMLGFGSSSVAQERWEVAKVDASWNATQPVPHSAQWHGPLADDNGDRVRRGVMELWLGVFAPHGAPVKYGFIGTYDIDSRTVYHYEHCSKAYSVLIRVAGTVVLNVGVRTIMLGKDEVSATLLSGRKVYSETFTENQQCRVYQFRESCVLRLVVDDMATHQTRVCIMVDGRVMRGNYIIKPKVKNQTTRKRRHEPVAYDNHIIHEYFEKRRRD